MPHDFNGTAYARASSHQKEWGARLIEELDLRGDERVLDLGCGDGALTARLAELLPAGEVTGIDASAGMLAAAAAHRRDNLHFVRMDIGQLDFALPFDVILSNAALHWVPDHVRLYASVLRLLRPGGKVRFNFAADGNCAHFFRTVREVMALAEFSPDFASFCWPWYMPPIAAYDAVVAQSGLHNVQVWGENADRYFADAAEMIRWVDQPSIVPFLAVLAAEKRAAFREAVVQRMVAATQQADGRCFETFRRVNVYGEA